MSTTATSPTATSPTATAATNAYDRIRRFLAESSPPTPCLVIDVDTVLERYAALTATFPEARVQYAVKANPEPAVLTALTTEGAAFDVASPAEIDLCLAAGADARRLSYGNTVKKPADIARAHAAGVREFVFEAEGDLANLASHAPGAEVSARVLVPAPASVTPFGRKFGTSADRAASLLVRAAELGLDPVGVSFHVGSQQLAPTAWDAGIATAARVFAATAARGVTLRRLNVGGGIAVDYVHRAPPAADYAAAIATSLRTHFPTERPELVLEPGRAVVAEAGLLRTEVVLVSVKPDERGHDERWVYLDVGRYNGLAETENEAIPYRFALVDAAGHGDGTEEGPVIIAGPTCDGDDVLYQRERYRLPLTLRGGEQLDILATGAYTASYSSVAFNGIEPLRTYCLRDGRPLDDR